ncbi:MAG TPA: DNA cytosine methyltransferase [Steroidobacter sp.]|jgi:DNA (cytosine-5)-methyltransferase 1|nr:DNA cytosine methyltransferase [Steroidobacter sp.]
MNTYYEFFAGGGMARAGLGDGWSCLFANDFDQKKGAAYARNWGAGELRIADVATLATHDLPAQADLAWASFPCQDLSLAGAGAGLKGERSGTFWPFWRLMQSLADEQRSPRLIVLENVCGALTSHGGRDFRAIASALAKGGYRFGAVVIDAVHFVPQSRPRLFVIAIRKDCVVPTDLTQAHADGSWHTASLIEAQQKLSSEAKRAWLWWRLPLPPASRKAVFADLIEEEPQSVVWHTPAETRRLLELMSPLNRKKVADAQKAKRRMVGAIYRRTRRDERGERVQRAEIRFDEVAGCLRTPAGGSSRQTIMIVEGSNLRSRLLSPREAARLMGLPDSYQLPNNYNEAYHLAGDGLVVPVVRHLAQCLLEPLLCGQPRIMGQAA